MRASARPGAINRNGGRQSAIRNTPRISRGATDVTRREDSYHNATRLLTERSEQVSRLETEYHQQSRLSAAHSRTNASHIDLVLERDGRIIQEVSYEQVLRIPPHERYATQRSTNARRDNPVYQDSELRALTIVDDWCTHNVLQSGDRIILRGPDPSCMDCSFNLQRFTHDLMSERQINITFDMEHMNSAAIIDARTQTNPRNNLAPHYGDMRSVRQQAPMGGSYFRMRYTHEMADTPPWDARQLRFQFGEGVSGNRNNNRVYLERNNNPPQNMQEQFRNEVTEPIASPEEVLARFFRK